MPCGCQKNKKTVPGTMAARVAAQKAEALKPAGTTQAYYEIKVGGQVVDGSTNPVTARERAKELGGSIRVTTRPFPAGDPVPV